MVTNFYDSASPTIEAAIGTLTCAVVDGLNDIEDAINTGFSTLANLLTVLCNVNGAWVFDRNNDLWETHEALGDGLKTPLTEIGNYLFTIAAALGLDCGEQGTVQEALQRIADIEAGK